ncbi:hypothetical protein [Halomarina ordinaria]|uniref:Uncharacterized protein n=1 Tax=Halomarina ordinaria TaxID=3033939 RepID=A0ABD5UDI1_9EURY|nr:hypothetical protein [Halomarina sp. PSRA2]
MQQSDHTHAPAYDDASYAADAAVERATAGEWGLVPGHLRTVVESVDDAPYPTQVQQVHHLAEDIERTLDAADPDHGRALAQLRSLRRVVEELQTITAAPTRA